MAQLSFPLENTDYLAEDAQLWFATRLSGVYSADANLAVTAAGGMRIAAGAGIAWLNWAKFKGIVYGNTDTIYFDIDMADGALNRMDRIVVRYNIVLNTVALAVKKGAFGGTPAAPPVQRDSDIYEIALADVYIGRGAVEITPANITDQRLNESLCGIMRDGVTGIPTAQLKSQWESWFTALKTDAEASADDFEAWMELFKTNAGNEFTSWLTGKNNEFTAWFESIKDILDENIAAHLLGLIEGLDQRLDASVQTLEATIQAVDSSIRSDTAKNLKLALPSTFQKFMTGRFGL